MVQNLLKNFMKTHCTLSCWLSFQMTDGGLYAFSPALCQTITMAKDMHLQASLRMASEA